MKMGAHRSPKLEQLMRIARLTRREAVGTLELLWLFTMEQSPSGDVGKWEDQEIESACDWSGEPGKLVSALAESRWLDPCLEHRLLVHDWADHAPPFLQKRAARGALSFSVLSLPQSDHCPDKSDQRSHSLSLSQVKSKSESKPREPLSDRRERLGQARRNPPKRSPKRSVSAGVKTKSHKTEFPPEGFTPEMKRQLLAYPKMQELNLTPSQASHAVERVKLWAAAGGHRRVDWVAVTSNSILAEWGLQGHASQGKGRGNGIRSPRLPIGKTREEMLAADSSLRRVEDLSEEERAEIATTGDQIRTSLSQAQQARKDTAAVREKLPRVDQSGAGADLSGNRSPRTEETQ